MAEVNWKGGRMSIRKYRNDYPFPTNLLSPFPPIWGEPVFLYSKIALENPGFDVSDSTTRLSSPKSELAERLSRTFSLQPQFRNRQYANYPATTISTSTFIPARKGRSFFSNSIDTIPI